MLRDVFYYGKKPNVHPKEKFAKNFADAKQQSTTEHFWIINEFCDYKGFDWGFDFDFLPDEDVWAVDHNNVWPSMHQKDSGTWLCNTDNDAALTIYRADVNPIKRKNEKNDCWVELDNIDHTKFDFSWHPDPTDSPYIYVWGSKFAPAQLKSCLEYHVPGAVQFKYMDDIVELLPNSKCWVEVQAVDKDKFDMSWRPNPLDPPLIYVWGNKYNPVEIDPVLEYHCAGATERKYVTDVLAVLPETSKWKEIILVDKAKFDMSWRPDPREPAYIYVWGNKYDAAEVKPTIEYHCSGATERKYMGIVELEPEWSRWTEHVLVDKTKFDMSWRPDPNLHEPPYIYVWGNKYDAAEVKPTLTYTVPSATEKKYMGIVELEPEWSRWNILTPINTSNFDFSWRPDPNINEPPYIYVWGNKYNPVEIDPVLEYHFPGATERKYMSDLVELLPQFDLWKEVQPVDKTSFDFTWRPDPREPAYIYVWGNKYNPIELDPALEYHCPGATERKYMNLSVDLLIETERWVELQPVDKTKFDLTWKPDPREPAYIYVWGNKYNPVEIDPALEYHCVGATERKYMTEAVELLPQLNLWDEVQSIDKTKFDLTWRPDPREPAYIYVWGNKHVPAELKTTISYTVPTATEFKYMEELVEVIPEYSKWKITQPVSNFDFTWRPDPREPAYIYVWGNKHIAGELLPTVEYYCDGATERKYVGEAEVEPNWNNFNILIPVDKTSFDFTWRPDPREPAYIYVWGNKYNSAINEPTIEYRQAGATDRKYMDDVVATTLPIDANWKTLIPVESFDYSWRPDPNEPPFIYVFGNQWYDSTTEATVEYHVPNATERKFITTIIATVSRTTEYWCTLIPVESFDYSWRPNPHSSPFIYVFGNQWHDSVTEPTIEYHQPGATTKKYITDINAIVKSTSTDSVWKNLIEIESFDYSWRPDPNEPPYIYVFGNKWNDSATEPTIEYHVEHATDYKYVSHPVAVPKAHLQYWSINRSSDLETFDFTWRPNPHSPVQTYQWADNGPTYTVPGAATVVYMEHDVSYLKQIVNRYKIKTTLSDLVAEHPTEMFWAINPDLNYEKFDFSWRPNETNFLHVNVFGNEYSKDTQTYYVNGPMYMTGHREFNYVEGQTVEIDSNLSMFYIDRGNKQSNERFTQLQLRYPHIQKTRYLNSWVDTINRCVNKSTTNLCWVLNSELDYSSFEFDFYPSPWQQKMVHVFGTQWSHWGNTYLVNKETFTDDTKYVKIIEHLSMLNFVKSKKAVATNCLYEIVLIDHGNDTVDTINGLAVTKIEYSRSYLNTFKKILEILPTKSEHYVWICSSICNYGSFDFSYICDPYAKDQLHVFPSDKQKFGDTFLVDVNKLRTLISDMRDLEDYEKINFNVHQRVSRLPAPVITVQEDTHCDINQYEFNFPYAELITADQSGLVINNDTPMSIWAPKHKNIIVKNSGGSQLTIPKEAKEYIERELYDYPYITRMAKLDKSNPMDIVFLSNGEVGADENYQHLLNVTKGLPNRVVRVDGVDGRVNAYHAAAEASNTPWMFTVFAKLKVNKEFDWNWQPDRLQLAKHYIFHATNPVNRLVYGHQAMIAYNKKLTLANTGTGLDFTLDDEHEVVEVNSGIANYNTDAWSTWRTSFRESLKLIADDSTISKDRLKYWLSDGTGDFAQYSREGAEHAVQYYKEVDGDLAKLLLSYEWNWLREKFNTYYK